MDEVLRSLGGLLLKAVPTFLLIVLLHFYLKRVYFGPMARVLSERYNATEGARKMADESLAKASQKAAEYESAIRAARSDIYREQEEFRQKLRQDQMHAAQEARQRADATVKEASRQLAGELESAKRSLALQTESLADEIAKTVLHRRAV
jgi:F-type H+-transporting ATPase subunit b